jgi:hypothetical protein
MMQLLFFLIGLPALALGIYGCFDARIDGVVVFLGFAFGLCFSAGGAFVLWCEADERKQALSLEENGRWVEAEIQWIEKEDDSLADDEASYSLLAIWKDPDTGQTVGFQASEVAPNPAPYIRNNRIQVRVDERDVTNYAIDWSFLPDEQ